MGPRYVGDRPVRGRPRPQSRALERRRYLYNVPLANSELHLCGISDHLHRVPVSALIAGLGHQSLKPRADFTSREVARGGDELNPEGHRPLAAVAEFEHRAARQGAIVHEVEHSHLVQVDDDLELRRRDDVEALEPAAVVRQGG